MKQNSYAKTLLLALASLTVPALNAAAQVTLAQASYSAWTPGSDTTQSVASFSASPGTNVTWDLSAATYSNPSVFARTAVSGNASYPQSTYSVPGSYAFSGPLAYQDIEMNGIGATGIFSYGQALQRQPVSLATLTGGANDSLVFNQQNIVYSSPKKNLAFPATAGTKYTSTYSYDLNFLLTVAAYSLNKTPGYQRSYLTYTDTVAGWGKMRVKALAGQASGYMDVLAVKVAWQQKDSFFLGGAVAPPALTTAFGLTQGQTNNGYFIVYYRAGTPTPLLSVVYGDAGYSTVTSSSAHAAKLLSASTAVTGAFLMEPVAIFPNPVTTGALHIQAGGLAGKACAYELTDGAGRLVESGGLIMQGGKATIHPAQAAGVYYLSVSSEGRVSSPQPVVIQQ